MSANLILDAALDYRKRGFSIIPVSSADKKPLIKWEEYQHQHPTETEVRKWFQNPRAQVAVVTGAISGIVVVDIEAGGTIEEFPKTSTVKTGGGGWHLWYKHPGHPVANAVKIKPLVDIRGDGGYVVAPPSLHPSGNRYEWIQPLNGEPLVPFPSDLFPEKREPIWPKALGTVPEGERNDTLASFAGRILQSLPEPLWESVAWVAIRERIKNWNSPTAHPFTEKEARTVFESIAERERKKRPNQAEEPSTGAVKKLYASHWPDPPDEIAYSGLAGEIVRAIAPHTEADPVALLIQFLVAFGNAIGRGPHFMVEADIHYLNLFAALVGATSKGRKGTSLGHVLRLLKTIDNEWSLERKQSGLSSGEGLLWAVRDPITKWDSKKNKEIVEDAGISDKRLMVVEPELARTLRVMSRDGSTLSSVIRELWDTGDVRSLTKNSPAKTTGAHASIIGHITRDELLRYLDNTEAGNGFGNRFLWVCVKRSKCLPEGGQINQVDFAPLIKRLGEVVAFARTVAEMRRDDEARKIWAEVYPALSQGNPGLFGAVTSRAEAQVTRLSCLYALSDLSSIVRAGHLKAALAFWEYCAASAQYIFGTNLGYPFADSILRNLRTTSEGMTRTDLQNSFGRNRKASEIDQALRFLNERSLVVRRSEPTDGRSAERWFAA